MQSICHGGACTPPFRAVLDTEVEAWSQPKCPATEECAKMTSTQRNTTQPQKEEAPITWINPHDPEDTTLRETSQVQEDHHRAHLCFTTASRFLKNYWKRILSVLTTKKYMKSYICSVHQIIRFILCQWAVSCRVLLVSLCSPLPTCLGIPQGALPHPAALNPFSSSIHPSLFLAPAHTDSYQGYGVTRVTSLTYSDAVC